MTVENTKIESVKIMQQFRADDNRGAFIKTFHKNDFTKAGIEFDMRESFFSTSNQGVIRGMHFHLPPFAHSKIVFCTAGSILDVAVDLRKKSPTYGQFVSEILSFENNKALYIPEGFAHGFASLTPMATTFYFVSGEYNATADGGIKYNSFGMDWQIKNPIVSARDEAFVGLQDFNSPF